jgi:hypothetical protein
LARAVCGKGGKVDFDNESVAVRPRVEEVSERSWRDMIISESFLAKGFDDVDG